ncbi:hypothetical protein BH23CHL7_BH23CHL7_16580 [soil metagenome]
MGQVTERLSQPRVALAILLLGLTGGLIAVFLFARGELVGTDARAYWGAVRVWLAGGDPYQQVGAYMPYAYAPWTLVLFLPWAMLPWSVAWFSWQVMNVALFCWSVGWAYRRRPLATALLVAALGVPLAAHLDTGNVGLLLVLGIWLAWFAGPRVGGLAWALAAAMKWLPLVLIGFIPRRARPWGVGFLALFVLLALATWPLTLRQLEVVLGYPRPLRLDYLIFAWAAVPWLWSQPWPPWWLRTAEIRERWRGRRPTGQLVREFLGFSPGRPTGSAGTSTPAEPSLTAD